MTNTFREITDVLPFKGRCNIVTRDKRLVRHAVLCTPFIEQIVPASNLIIGGTGDQLSIVQVSGQFGISDKFL